MKKQLIKTIFQNGARKQCVSVRAFSPYEAFEKAARVMKEKHSDFNRDGTVKVIVMKVKH